MAEAKPKVGLDRSKTGRKKGTPNKTTTLLKEAILMAAEAADKDGIVGYLTLQAHESPASFLALLGKVLPTTLVGDPTQPLILHVTHGGIKQ